MDSNIIGIITAIALFVAGMFVKDKLAERARIKEELEDAANTEQEGAADAKDRYQDKVAKARAEAQREIDSRPTAGDPSSILADRKQRHAAIVKRHQRRRGRQRGDTH